MYQLIKYSSCTNWKCQIYFTKGSPGSPEGLGNALSIFTNMKFFELHCQYLISFPCILKLRKTTNIHYLWHQRSIYLRQRINKWMIKGKKSQIIKPWLPQLNSSTRTNPWLSLQASQEISFHSLHQHWRNSFS